MKHKNNDTKKKNIQYAKTYETSKIHFIATGISSLFLLVSSGCKRLCVVESFRDQA